MADFIKVIHTAATATAKAKFELIPIDNIIGKITESGAPGASHEMYIHTNIAVTDNTNDMYMRYKVTIPDANTTSTADVKRDIIEAVAEAYSNPGSLPAPACFDGSAADKLVSTVEINATNI